MEGVTSFFKAAKAAVLNIPEMEQKVIDATNNQKWGPTGPEMKEISSASFKYTEFPIIMKTIWARLCERNPIEWRHVYKSLLLLDYMLKNGSYQVVTDAQAHSSILSNLYDYAAFEGGEDKGISVRERARVICELLTDKVRLEEDREKASANRQKFQASMSSEGGRGGSYDGNNSNSYSNDPYASNNSSGYGGNSYPQSSNQGGGYGGNPNTSSPSASRYNNNNNNPTSSSISGGYGDSRPNSSTFSSSANDKYDDRNYISDSESEEDIPASVQAQAQNAGRPRAPSGGGASSMGFPSTSGSSNASIDFLGLSNAPVAPVASVAPVALPNGPSTSQSFFDNPTAFAGASNTAESSWDAFGQQNQVQTQQIPQSGGVPIQGTQTLNGQIRRDTATVSASKPKLSEADAKDPWKKGADLISLDSLSTLKPDLMATPASRGQKISLGNQTSASSSSQYSNLRGNMMGTGNSMMGGNMNMNGGNMMGGNMNGGNMNGGNMMGGNSMMGGNMNGGNSMMGGNMNGGNMNYMNGNMMGGNSMMGGNPNMMGGNMNAGNMNNMNGNMMGGSQGNFNYYNPNNKRM